MLLTVKRTLTISFVAAVAVLPAMSAHQAAHAASTTAAASASPAAAARSAAAAAKAAGQTAAAGRMAVTDSAAAARRHHHRSRRMRAYIYAAHQRGKPYCWGGTHGCFDCSGLVFASYRHAGIALGRDTFDMLASSRLIRVSHRRAKRGDLAFYGTGHVELVAGRRYTLGALHSGTLIGWHRISSYWHPTMYFRIRHAG